MRVDRGRGLFACDHCGSEQDAPALIGGIDLLTETADTCPVCSTLLSTGRFEGYALLCCPRCFGMVIDMAQFAAIIDAMRAVEGASVRVALPRRQHVGDRTIACPKCQRTMVGHVYAGPGNVVIDTCEACQVNWLDPGELRRIAIAPDTTSA
jgi:Zn-finger nucleic acid-binding protein